LRGPTGRSPVCSTYGVRNQPCGEAQPAPSDNGGAPSAHRTEPRQCARPNPTGFDDDSYRPPPTRAGLSKRRGRSTQGRAPPAVHGTRTHHSSRSERYAWATTYCASAIATPPIRCRDSPNAAMAMPQWSPVSRRNAGWRKKVFRRRLNRVARSCVAACRASPLFVALKGQERATSPGEGLHTERRSSFGEDAVSAGATRATPTLSAAERCRVRGSVLESDRAGIHCVRGAPSPNVTRGSQSKQRAGRPFWSVASVHQIGRARSG
jgi:hypothetical protein